ncbi:peptide/nickel transport system substrate-binding protein [Tamaricihabitans halophyticus]|uniref:Peptide/nickel transport system substrate-binding protein n=1 Tax=Tamaricihabitans halophyticus TaxID=1262583 RepID=A0A4R2QCX0_9PSEU|nr:ABC transporter substrate-binding protein [Tamaricihabitans halophyticus]TCP46807.1 peptide/nickel transport system substrate-binding protein [Tamaricihabitans halophyticus]
MSHRKRARLASRTVPLLVVGLLTSACFSGVSVDSEAGKEVKQLSGPPQPGGIYRYAVPSDARSLDPHEQSSYNTHIAIGSTYSKLVDFKTGPDIPYASHELEGDLAESWQQSNGGARWTFNLREGVRFHDVPPVNGREFTSADVRCTMDRIRELPGHQVNLISTVDSIETPDDYTVIFNLSQRQAEFDTNMANHFMWMLPCEGTRGEFDLGTQAIGTGAFVLDKWERNRERVLSAHPNYYEKDKPHLDGIHVAIVPDQGAAAAALRTARIDYLSTLSFDKRMVDLLRNQTPRPRLAAELSFSPVRIYLNQEKEPFDDLRVRRAIALAIDRENMLNSLRPGGSSSAAVTPKLFGGLPPEEVDRLQPYDPRQARALLAEAGYPNGFSAEMIVTDGYGETVVREAQWVQQDLAKVGINVELDVQDYATYFTESWAKKNYEMGFGLQTPMLSSDEFLSTEWHSEGARNWYGIADPKLDRMIDEQRPMLDADEREQAIHEIQRYIVKNVSNPITLYLYEQQALYAPYTGGAYPHPDYGTRHLADVFLGDEAPGRG